MFGNYFYHKRVRTAVSVFGSLFNNLHILRQNSSGEVISQVKVPLSYAPKRNFIERLNEMAKGEEAERRVAMKLPRMSFEITAMAYDAARQLPKVNRFEKEYEDNKNTRYKMYTATPYDITFQLSIYAKSQDDALQVVEQILPYFAPQYTVTVKPFSDIPDIKEDVPISLDGVNFEDAYDGAIEQRRTIVYNLDFTMKINFYGPNQDYGIIREVNNNLYIMGDSDTFYTNINVTPTPVGVSPDSDYGFLIQYLDSSA